MVSIESLQAHPPPLHTDGDGVVRVGRTRVSLDSVIIAFNNGITAEEIVIKYPSLSLTDVYAVITYYLWHRTEIDAYLVARREIAEQVRIKNEESFPGAGIRERLLSRRRKGA